MWQIGKTVKILKEERKIFETPLERLKIHAEYAQLDNDCCIVNREDLQYLIREYEEITKKLQKQKKFVKFSTKNEKTPQK